MITMVCKILSFCIDLCWCHNMDSCGIETHYSITLIVMKIWFRYISNFFLPFILIIWADGSGLPIVYNIHAVSGGNGPDRAVHLRFHIDVVIKLIQTISTTHFDQTVLNPPDVKLWNTVSFSSALNPLLVPIFRSYFFACSSTLCTTCW
jgi:hypothetical protein